MAGTETFEFQAETTQLLNLVINSLYTSKDIFLRELVSNASDALDRLRFEALTRPELLGDEHQLEIRLEPDASARTLTIHDTGIGMSRDEVIANIGTIAKSGTRELLKQATESGSSSELLSRLIGQFGVGFYSAFMVADRVELVTRKPGEATAARWESAGDGSFTVSETSRTGHGTSITLHLKPVDPDNGIEDYADTTVLERIIKRYSDFITHPIKCEMTRTEPVRDDEGKPKEGETQEVVEDRTLNAQKPIWTRPSGEVEDTEYAEFYRHVSHDWTEPQLTLALKAEGILEYWALLFVPSQPPFDLALNDRSWGLQLYAKQVMIMERCEDLLPPFLRFVRGVVDSADLPLNVSRETLQQDRHIVHIRKWLTGRVLKRLEELKKSDRSGYVKLWNNFGRFLKEGFTGEGEHKDRLKELLLLESSADAEKLTDLAEYVERMPSDQPAIYYITGDDRRVIEASPHLEAFTERGYEVLFLTDPVDEIVVQSLTDYEEKKLRSVAKGELDLGSEEEKEQAKGKLEEKGKELADVLSAVQKRLEEHVREVRLSGRLKSSPACLVGSEWDMSPQLERMMRNTPYKMPRQKRILELNPDHEIVTKLAERYEADHDDPMVHELAELLHGYALIAEGSELPDPVRFNALLAKMMAASA